MTCPKHCIASILFALHVHIAVCFYRNTDVVELDPKSFRAQVMRSSAIWMVEFYAPWCGQCKKLQPEYARAASLASGVVKFGAVDCDAHTSLAKEFGISAFPTLKVFAENKYKPIDYQLERTAKGMAANLLKRLPSKHITRVTPQKEEAFMAKDPALPRVLLFTEKNITAPLYKALSLEFKKRAVLGEVRVKKDKALAAKYGVDEFPTILSVHSEKMRKYDGEINLEAIVQWLEQALPESLQKKTPTTSSTSAKSRKPGAKSTTSSKSTTGSEATTGAKSATSSKSTKGSKATTGAKSTTSSKSTTGSKATTGAKSATSPKSTTGSKATTGAKSTTSSKSTTQSKSTAGAKSTASSKSTTGSKRKVEKVDTVSKSSKASKTSEGKRTAKLGASADAQSPSSKSSQTKTHRSDASAGSTDAQKKADYRKQRDTSSASRSRTSSPADSKPRKASGAAKEDLRTKAQKAEAAMLKRMEAKKAKEAPVLGSEVVEIGSASALQNYCFGRLGYCVLAFYESTPSPEEILPVRALARTTSAGINFAWVDANKYPLFAASFGADGSPPTQVAVVNPKHKKYQITTIEHAAPMIDRAIDGDLVRYMAQLPKLPQLDT